jgi:hypothetical protein
MSADDIIYAPIVPADELRDLVKRIMRNPSNRKVLDNVSDRIVDLFGRHGVFDEQEIVDAVYRTIKELEANTARENDDAVRRRWYMDRARQQNERMRSLTRSRPSTQRS